MYIPQLTVTLEGCAPTTPGTRLGEEYSFQGSISKNLLLSQVHRCPFMSLQQAITCFNSAAENEHPYLRYTLSFWRADFFGKVLPLPQSNILPHAYLLRCKLTETFETNIICTWIWLWVWYGSKCGIWLKKQTKKQKQPSFFIFKILWKV